MRFGSALLPGIVMISVSLAVFRCDESQAMVEEDFQKFADAQQMYRNNRFDTAEEQLLALRQNNPNVLEVEVLLAKIKFFTRKFDEAEGLLGAYLEHDPGNPYALMWLGKTIAVDPERQEEAAQVFREIVRRDPENYMARYHLGRCLEAQQQLQPAIREYQMSSIGLGFQLSKIHLHMGRVLARHNNEERAERHFAVVRALAVNDNDVRQATRIQGAEEE